MELEFKTLTMMELRGAPGEILDQVNEGQAFIIERNGRPKACLVPVWYFQPDIPKDKIFKVNEELDTLREKGEKPFLTISSKNELEILFKEKGDDCEITLTIVLPHGYPNNAPKIYASPILNNAPHRWQDGALCVFGVMNNWNPGKHNVASALILARKWLFNYKEWRITGSWPTNSNKANGQR